MDEIIERIIEIENAAADLLKNAKEEREGLSDTIDSEVERLENEVREKAKKKQEELKSFEDGEADKKIEEIEKHLKASSERIEKTAAEKREGWVRELVNTVIK